MADFKENSSFDFFQIRWLDKYMIGHSGFIAGGCFKHIFCNEKVKDIDVFFRNETEHKMAIIYFSKSKDFFEYYRNEKVVAFKEKDSGIVIELICTVYGTAPQIIDNFDFTITKFAYYKKTEEDENGEKITTYSCLYSDKFFEHLQTKKLVVDNKALYPISTFERMFRYAKYGYFPCRETKKKIIEEIFNLEKLPEVSLSLYDGLD